LLVRFSSKRTSGASEVTSISPSTMAPAGGQVQAALDIAVTMNRGAAFHKSPPRFTHLLYYPQRAGTWCDELGVAGT
jgi:hypothetical protein